MAYLATYLCDINEPRSKRKGMAKTSIQFIKEAAKKLVNSKLQRLGATKTQEAIKGVMRTIGLETPEEACLFVAHFDLTCRDKPSNMDDLSSYFECSSLDIIEYAPALKSLEGKELIVRRGRKETNILRQNYAVSDAVMAAIIENKPICVGKVNVGEVEMDKYEFCKRIAEKVEDTDVVTEDLVLYVEKMENENPNLSLVQNLRKGVQDILDRILFYDMCHDN